jgi:hypothetical protein
VRPERSILVDVFETYDGDRVSVGMAAMNLSFRSGRLSRHRKSVWSTEKATHSPTSWLVFRNRPLFVWHSALSGHH